MRRLALIPNKGEDMKTVVTLFLLSGVTMMLLACAQVSPVLSDNGNVEPAKQPHHTKPVFPSFELDLSDVSI